MKSEVFHYNGSPVTFQLGEVTIVNATQMAKLFGKRPVDWLRLPSTQTFIQTLGDVRKSHNTTFVVTVKGNSSNFEQGTWMYEDVALEFARWLSPAFAIWCNDRIKEFLRHGITATPMVIDAMLNDPETMIRTLQALKSESGQTLRNAAPTLWRYSETRFTMKTAACRISTPVISVSLRRKLRKWSMPTMFLTATAPTPPR